MGASGKHPFSNQGYLIHYMSVTTTPRPLILGAFNGWRREPYKGASPPSDHIQVTTAGDQQWGTALGLAPAEYNSHAAGDIGSATRRCRPRRGPATPRPVPNFIPVSQYYGSNPTPGKRHPIFGNYLPLGHTGIDYAAAVGTDTYAVGPGTVLYAGYAASLPGDDFAAGWASRWCHLAKGFAGNVPVIDHGPFLGVYAYLSAFLVKKDDRVVQGQRVALTGNTGASSGPHLHFEVIPTVFTWGNGMYGRVDPANYLTLRSVTVAPDYTGDTTTIAPTKEWYGVNSLSLQVAAAIRAIVREKVKAGVIRNLTYLPSQARRRRQNLLAGRDSAHSSQRAVDPPQARRDRGRALRPARAARRRADRLRAVGPRPRRRP